MSRGTIGCNFRLTCIDNQPIRTVVTGGREIHAFLEDHWIKCIPPMRIYPPSYTNSWAINNTRTCFHLLWSPRCVRLRSLGRSQSNAHWSFVSTCHCNWQNSAHWFQVLHLLQLPIIPVNRNFWTSLGYTRSRIDVEWLITSMSYEIWPVSDHIFGIISCKIFVAGDFQSVALPMRSRSGFVKLSSHIHCTITAGNGTCRPTDFPFPIGHVNDDSWCN